MHQSRGVLPKVDDSDDKSQLRTLTQLVLDSSEVRQKFPPAYMAHAKSRSIGNSVIISHGTHHGPICLPCCPRIISPSLSPAFPIRRATQVSGLRALTKERRMESETGFIEVHLR